MIEVKIPYKRRKWSVGFHDSSRRFLALVLHRRAGKTTAIINHQQRAATDDAWEARRMKTLMPSLTEEDLKKLLHDRLYGIVYPTYKQAKLVAWEMLKYYAREIPGIKPNESELSIRYPNNCKLQLFGAENPDALRGTAFWGLAFDEYGQQPSNIFSEVLSKSLADHLGFAIFAGTIQGKNQLYMTHKIAADNPRDYFALWQDIDVSLRTEEDVTTRLLRIALEDDRRLVQQGLMTQEEFDQEWYLSPTGAVRGAVYAKEIAQLRKDNRVFVFPIDARFPVHTVWDLGKGAKMAVGFYQRNWDRVMKVDYLEGDNNDGLPQVIKKMLEKPYVFGKHFAPHDVNAVDLSTGKTRIETARVLGVKFETVPDIGVLNGINAAKLFFSRLYVHEKNCDRFLELISQYRREWDDKKGAYRDEPIHDFTSHAADEFRYAAIVEDQMVNELEQQQSVEYAGAIDPYGH